MAPTNTFDVLLKEQFITSRYETSNLFFNIYSIFFTSSYNLFIFSPRLYTFILSLKVLISLFFVGHVYMEYWRGNLYPAGGSTTTVFVDNL